LLHVKVVTKVSNPVVDKDICYTQFIMNQSIFSFNMFLLY